MLPFRNKVDGNQLEKGCVTEKVSNFYCINIVVTKTLLYLFFNEICLKINS